MSMLITKLWYEKQTVLSQSNQLLKMGFKRKWPQPSLKGQPAIGQGAHSCSASSMGGSQAVWIQVSFECEFSRVSEAVEYSGHWGGIWTQIGLLERMDIVEPGEEAKGKPFLTKVLNIISSKCWNINAACHYKSFWIFCNETAVELDGYCVHYLMVKFPHHFWMWL